MKLIIEHCVDGKVFVYEESNRHHKAVEGERASSSTLRTLEELADECEIAPGEHFVIPIVEV